MEPKVDKPGGPVVKSWASADDLRERIARLELERRELREWLRRWAGAQAHLATAVLLEMDRLEEGRGRNG